MFSNVGMMICRLVSKDEIIRLQFLRKQICVYVVYVRCVCTFVCVCVFRIIFYFNFQRLSLAISKSKVS